MRPIPPGATPALRAGEAALPPTGFVLLAGLALFWGANWPFMKIVLDEMAIWPFRSLCLLVGGGAMLILAGAGGHSLRIPTSELRPLLLCTLFNIIGWHLFSGYGVSMMPAGRASIIAFTMPLWAALFARFVLGERLTGFKIAGLVLGLAGLAVLVGPELRTLGTAPLGAVFMLGAAVSWATGTVLMKRFSWTMPVIALAGWQLMLGSVPITIGAVLFERYPAPGELSTAALLSLAYVLVVPMIFCHWAWFKVVRLFPAAIAAIGTLAIPIVGVFSSAVVLAEPVGLREIVALGLVCSALVVVLVLPVLRRPRPV